MNDPRRGAFAYPDFRRFFGIAFLAGIVHQMQAVALGWDIYERTDSTLALGLVGLATFLPALLLFIPAGQLADRHDRRRLMQWSLGLWALGVAVLATVSAHPALAGASGVPWLYAGCVLTSIANVIHRPPRDALVPQIVPAESLPAAQAWHSSAQQIGSVTGPAIAGGLIALGGGAAWVHALDAGLLLVSLALASAIRTRGARAHRPPVNLSELLAGLAHVWRTRVILGVLAVDMFAVLLGGATVLLPVFARDILHVGPAGLGWLSAAPAIGAFAMAWTLARRALRPAGPLFFLAVAGYGIATVVFGLSQTYALSFLALVAIGALDNVSVVIRMTVVQLHTPDALRGRVSAVHRVFVSSSNELGALESGLLAALTSPVFAVVAGGIATLAIVAAATRLFPELRRLQDLSPPAWPASPHAARPPSESTR